jgi:LemA protein
VIVVVAVVALFLWSAFNGLVRSRNQVDNAWSQIDVQLKRRHDLIPNLVESVKGYMQFEQDTLTKVTNARAAAVAAGAQGPAAQAQAENTLTSTLRSLFAVVENYPDLKANQNVVALQEELTTTENKISFARQFYNDSVMTYNTKIQSFPANTIAGMFNFTSRQFFEGEAADREVPKVDLGLQAPTVQLQQPAAPVAPAPAPQAAPPVQQPAAPQQPPAPPQPQPPAPPQQ